MERRHNSMGHKMSDFFLGLTDFFNPGRPIRHRDYGLSPQDDRENLKKDWEQVGQYLRDPISNGQQHSS